MTRSRIAVLVAGAVLVPIVAAAQVPAASPTEQDKRQLETRVAQGGRLVASVETRVTTGRPYTAEAVTESLQVLGDGNRISRKSSTRVFRDGQGRTRREQGNAAGETITIWDPVASTSFTLDPATKTAYQAGLVALKTPFATGGGVGGGRAGAVARAGVPLPTEASKTEEARRRENETAARVEQAETSRAASGQMRQVLELAASGGGRTTKEELGQQSIEGVMATGTRSTTIIPAGSSIGNAQEIKIVSEQWFSPDLEVLVMTRHSDPRVGETIYRLTNIVRAEPDPALFVVPGDYTIKQRGIRSPQ